MGRGLLDSAHSERNVESWNFLISRYVVSGLAEEARRVFDEMQQKDVFWNAIISGYAHVG